MKIRGFDNELHPGITMHKIPVKAGFAGLVFTLGMMFVCLMGIPAMLYFFVLAIMLGIGVAVMLRFIPRQAGLVVLVLTGVMIVYLANTPGTGEWEWRQELDSRLLAAAIAPPPPP